MTNWDSISRRILDHIGGDEALIADIEELLEDDETAMFGLGYDPQVGLACADEPLKTVVPRKTKKCPPPPIDS